MPKKILYISNTGHAIGGAQQCLLRLLESLDRQYYQPVVIIPHAGTLETIIKKMGVSFYIQNTDHLWFPNKYHYYNYLKSTPARIAYLTEIINHEKIDLVHSFDMYAFDGAIAAFYTNVPHILHAHNLFTAAQHPLLEHTNIGFHEWASILNHSSHSIIAVSNRIKANIIEYGVDENIINVIHNGIDPDYFLATKDTCSAKQLRDNYAIPENAFLITCIGRITSIKNMEAFVDAAAIIHDKNTNTRFFIVGPDEEKQLANDLRKKVENYNLKNVFYFLGPRTDIPTILEASNLFVSTSTVEGLPITFLEAMSASLPIIAMKYEGIEEVIVDGDNGILIEQRDVSDLAAKILKLCDNPEQSSRMGKSGRIKVIKDFSTLQYIDKHTHIYHRLLTTTRGPVSNFNEKLSICRFIINQLSQIGELGIENHTLNSRVKSLEDFVSNISNSFIYKSLKLAVSLFRIQK